MNHRERAAEIMGAWYLDTEPGDDLRLQGSIWEALNDVERETIESVLPLVQKWVDAYPEDIFKPVPKYSSQSEHEAKLITRASAQHGRHMGKCLIEQIRALIVAGEEKKETGDGQRN